MLVQVSVFGSWLHRSSHVLCFYVFILLFVFCDPVNLINLSFFLLSSRYKYVMRPHRNHETALRLIIEKSNR